MSGVVVPSLVRYRRQFVITNAKVERRPDWREYAISPGWTLYYQRELAVELRQAADGTLLILLGNALRFDPDRCIGAGRFAVVRWPEILTDGAALLGIHYGRQGDRVVVSSSPGLAAEVLAGGPVPPDVTEPLEHRSFINYIPMPGCGYSFLRKLLHDQALDIPACAPRHRPSAIAPLDGEAEALDVLADELCGFATELRDRVPGRIFLPLTSGLDSRTLLAAFVAAGVEVETVTLDYCGKPRCDVTVAGAISRRLGLTHHRVRLKGFDQAAADLLWEHTAGAFLDWDNTHILPGNGYRYLGPDDVVLFGNCFELGRQRSMVGAFSGICPHTSRAADIWERRTGAPGATHFCALLEEWLAWRRAHPTALDFGANFYLDQRLSGWRAGLDLGYDLLPGLSLNPANNPRVLAAMVTPDPEAQRLGTLQHQAIRRLAPVLTAFPVNPPTAAMRLRGARRKVARGLAACTAVLLPSAIRDPQPH